MMHIKYRAILELDDGTTKDTRRTSKRRMASFIRRINWKSGHIQVRYYQDGVFVGDNTGVCNTLEEMLKTLDTFTEPELLEYLA